MGFSRTARHRMGIAMEIMKRIVSGLLASRRVVGGVVFALVMLATSWYYVQKCVVLRMRIAAERPFGLQVYYQTAARQDYVESRSVDYPVSAGEWDKKVVIPADRVKALRLDFGCAPGTVRILDCDIGGRRLPPWRRWTFSPDVQDRVFDPAGRELLVRSELGDPFMLARLPDSVPGSLRIRFEKMVQPFFLALVLALLAASAVPCRSDEAVVPRTEGPLARACASLGLTPAELLFCVGCAVYYWLWSLAPYNCAPDEAMRFEVTNFLFHHGRLPVNDEIIQAKWGFSYAHLPTMLCNVLGAFCMKAASLFTSDDRCLLVAARMASVLCGAGTVYWLLRASRLAFGTAVRWVPVCLVALLPQFAFVSSYVNNDVVALFGMSMILYAWVASVETRWTCGNAVALAVGMSVCTMAYYNSYSWIMFSMLMFPTVYLCRNGRRGLVKMGLLIAVLTLLLSCYLFVRHYYYYGDLLGFGTTRQFALKYASPEFRPGARPTLFGSGVGLREMLFGRGWIRISLRSFVGCFGYMQYQLPEWCYGVYGQLACVLSAGVAWWTCGWMRRPRQLDLARLTLVLSLAGCAAIGVGLSVYYSYMHDFQPQGRYCFPALPALAFLAGRGGEKILDRIVVREMHTGVVAALCLALAYVSIAAFFVMRHSTGV